MTMPAAPAKIECSLSPLSREISMANNKNVVLKDHQLSTLAIMSQEDTGIIPHCTGSGKSYIISEHMSSEILSVTSPVIVVLSPYIMLNNQLQLDSTTYILNRIHNKTKVHLAVVHSGGNDGTADEITNCIADIKSQGGKAQYKNHGSSTSSKALARAVTIAQELNEPIIITGTYKSSERIYSALKKCNTRITTLHCDEAHYLLQKTTHDSIENLKNISDKFYTYTATLRICESGNTLGRDFLNSDFYGKILYPYTPRQGVQDGAVLPVRCHEMQFDGDDSNENVARTLPIMMDQHRRQLNNIDMNMLVTAKDSKMIKEVVGDTGFKKYCKDNNITIARVTSAKFDEDNTTKGTTMKIGDKEYTNRFNFLKDLKEHKGDLIVFHIRVLTAGIDVPGFTGGVAFRQLNVSDMLQFLGRLMRLHLTDKMNMSTGIIKPGDYDKFVNPYAWIILPVYKESKEDSAERLRDVVYASRSAEFENTEEIPFIESEQSGVDDDTTLKDNSPGKKSKSRPKTMFSTLFDEYLEDAEKVRLAYENKANLQTLKDTTSVDEFLEVLM